MRDKIGFLSSSFPVGLRLCKAVLPQRLVLGAVSSKMRARLAVGVLVSAAAAIASAVRLPGLDGAHVQPSARVSELFEQLKDSQETCKLTTCLGMCLPTTCLQHAQEELSQSVGCRASLVHCAG